MARKLKNDSIDVTRHLEYTRGLSEDGLNAQPEGQIEGGRASKSFLLDLPLELLKALLNI
jgi:hypothetical protein